MRPLVPAKNGLLVSSTILLDCGRQPCDTTYNPQEPAPCNTTDTDNGLVRFTAGNVGGQRTGLLRSVGSNPDMGEPDSPLPASWIPFEASGQAGLLLRIGVNPIGNEEYLGGTIQLMDEDCNPIGAPVGPITVNAASGLLGVYGANPALAAAFINGRVLSVQFIKP